MKAKVNPLGFTHIDYKSECYAQVKGEGKFFLNRDEEQLYHFYVEDSLSLPGLFKSHNFYETE